jgi:4a-hydroxytetrahydrobiopterin dehydratase
MIEDNMPQKLEASALQEALTTLPDWSLKDGELVRNLGFKDFVAAIHFVDQLAELAEAAGHHPDIDIRYNRVRLALVTHDAGGITRKDVKLAASVDNLQA